MYRPRKRRRSPSLSESEPEPVPIDDQGLEEERMEDMSAFTRRLGSKGNMIPVLYEKDQAAIHVQRALLSRASPKIKKQIERNMSEDGTRTLRFDAPAAVVKIFLFWLFHDRIPTSSEFPGVAPAEATEYQAQEQFQILLVRTWMFANDKELPAMQNLVMRQLFEEIELQMLSDHVLQESLLKTRRGMPMRMALLAELIWMDDVVNNDNTEDEEDDEKLLDQMKIDYVDGFNQDYENAMEAYGKRHKQRASAEDYLVKER